MGKHLGLLSHILKLFLSIKIVLRSIQVMKLMEAAGLYEK